MQQVSPSFTTNCFGNLNRGRGAIRSPGKFVNNLEGGAVGESALGNLSVEVFVTDDRLCLATNRLEIDLAIWLPCLLINARFVQQAGCCMQRPVSPIVRVVAGAAVNFPGCFTTRLGGDRHLDTSSFSLPEKHGLLDAEVFNKVLTGPKNLLSRSQGQFDVGSRGCDRGPLHLMIDQIVGGVGTECHFVEGVLPDRRKAGSQKRVPAVRSRDHGGDGLVADWSPLCRTYLMPAANPIEWVVRHQHPTARPRLIEGPPIETTATAIELTNAATDDLPVLLPWSQGGHPGGIPFGKTAAPHTEQTCRGTHFNDDGRLGFNNTGHTICKPDSVAQMVAPILCRRCLTEQLTGEIGSKIDPRWLKVNAGGRLLKFLQHFIHQGRVKCVRHIQVADPDIT